MHSVREPVPSIPVSLLSAASSHTVKPSIEPASQARVAYATPSLSLRVIAFGAFAAALGLGGAMGVARLRERSQPIAQLVSGSPVLKKSSDGESVRWHSAKTTIYLDSSLGKLSKHAADTVQLGFGTWLGSGAKLPALSFDSTKDASFGQKPNGKNEIMYGPITIKGHEQDLALTVTFSDPKTGEVVEADMIFNSVHPFARLSSDGKSSEDDDNDGSSKSGSNTQSFKGGSQLYDLQSVATHEAGHFFGLGEDFDVKTATMYYTTGRGEVNKRALSGSDETTMDSLYVKSEAQSSEDPAADTGKGCGGARIGQGDTRGQGRALMAVLGLLGFVGWRRRRR